MQLPSYASPCRALVGAGLACFTPVALVAGGMALTMQNGVHLGQAFSAGASAEDASTVFYNPAGLLSLERTESLISLSYIAHSGGFTNDGSVTAGTIPTSGGNGGTSGANALVPTFYVAHPFSDKLAFGFGISVPYGLATDYQDDWVGRYHALKSELKTLDFSPAVAWRATENISLGFGFDWQQVDATLTNAVDFGLIGFLNNVPGLLPGNADGVARVRGNDTSTGFNIGVLFNLSGSSRLGVHYRSKLEHRLRGPATFTGVPAPFAPLFADQNATAPLTLPEKVSVSFHYDVTPSLAFTADWSWWKWSRFQTLAVDFENPLTTDVALPQEWNNASIYSAGVRWAQSEALTLRAGIAFNESPVASTALRSARIPDADRLWLCLGASWRFAENLRGDIGFAHLSVDDASTLNDDGAGHVLRGDYSTAVNILSVQGTFNF